MQVFHRRLFFIVLPTTIEYNYFPNNNFYDIKCLGTNSWFNSQFLVEIYTKDYCSNTVAEKTACLSFGSV